MTKNEALEVLKDLSFSTDTNMDDLVVMTCFVEKYIGMIDKVDNESLGTKDPD